MSKSDFTRHRISDHKLMKLINPQCTIMENLNFIKSKGYKVSKDRICKFLKLIREKDDIVINNDIDEALEALNANRQQKTIQTKDFNVMLNKMLHELGNTPIEDFEAKKQQIVNWAISNYNKLERKARPFDEFMGAMRTYISELKNQASARIQEERIAEIKKDPLFRLQQLRGTIDEIIEEMKDKRIQELINELI